MAASGSFNLTVTGDYGNVKGWVTWKESSVDTVNNVSTVTAQLHYRNDWAGGSTSSPTASPKFYLVINGERKETTAGINLPASCPDKVALTHTVIVPHLDDGTKSITISGGGGLQGTSDLKNSSGSGTAVLTAIARATTPTLPETAWIGSEITIQLPRAASGFTHDLSYRLGDSGDFTAITTGAGASYTWTIPASLSGELPDSVSGRLSIRAVTKNGAATVGTKTANMTVVVPDSIRPTVTGLTVTIVNDNATVASWGVALKGFSRLEAEVTGAPAAEYGAVISETWVYFYGTEETIKEPNHEDAFRSSPLRKTSGKVEAWVKDARGRWSVGYFNTSDHTSTGTPDISVLDYSGPEIISGDAYRVDANGVASDEGTRLHVALSGRIFEVGQNAAAIKWRSRAPGGAWGGYTTLTSSTSQVTGITSAETVLEGPFSKESAWEIELSIWDSLGNSKAFAYTIPPATVTLHLREGGKAVGIGMYAQGNDRLDVAWPIWMKGRNMEYTLQLHGTLEIGSGHDLNTYTVPGVRSCPSKEVARSVKNTPYGTYGFKLIVEKLGGADASDLQQTLIPSSSAPYYWVRRKISGSWQPWRRVVLGAGVRAYTEEKEPGWRVQLVQERYFTAHLNKGYSSMSFPNAMDSGMRSTVVQYLPLPYPSNDAVLLGAGDQSGVYLGAMNRTNAVGARFRYYSPASYQTISNLNARLMLTGTVATPSDTPPTAYDSEIGAAIAGIADSYVAPDDTLRWNYGDNWMYSQAKDVEANHRLTDGEGKGYIECDTLVDLVLRGIAYENSYYFNAGANAVADYEDERGNILSPDTSKAWVSGLAGVIYGRTSTANPYFTRDMVYAQDIAWAMWYMGKVFDGTGAGTGDLVFWSDPYVLDKAYFGHITHVAVLEIENDVPYVYEASNYYDEVVHKVTLAEANNVRGQPCYYARIY